MQARFATSRERQLEAERVEELVAYLIVWAAIFGGLGYVIGKDAGMVGFLLGFAFGLLGVIAAFALDN